MSGYTKTRLILKRGVNYKKISDGNNTTEELTVASVITVTKFVYVPSLYQPETLKTLGHILSRPFDLEYDYYFWFSKNDTELNIVTTNQKGVYLCPPVI